MMNLTKVSNNRVHVEFGGKIDRDQVTKVLDEMFAAIADRQIRNAHFGGYRCGTEKPAKNISIGSKN